MGAVNQFVMGWSDWWKLAEWFLVLSAFSVGGPLILLPEMRRFLVVDQGWITDEQVAASVALAQSAPGPNVLFVALLGWNVGINAGSYWVAFIVAATTMICIMLPCSVILYCTAQWVQKNSHRRSVRAFKQGMSPVVVPMLIASGWTLATAGTTLNDWPLWALSAGTVFLVLWGKIPLVLLIAIGGVLGATGCLSL